MKISSTTKPNPYLIEKQEGKTYLITLATNIVSETQHDDVEDKDVTVYTYDKYTTIDSYFVNLKARLDSNFDSFIEKAKQEEIKSESDKVRKYRDELLNECDLKYCNPEKWENMYDTEKIEWAEYKNKLRNITLQQSFPYKVDWPIIPK